MGVLEDLLACKPITFKSAIDHVPMEDRVRISKKKNTVNKKKRNKKKKLKRNKASDQSIECSKTVAPSAPADPSRDPKAASDRCTSVSKQQPVASKNRRAYACSRCEVMVRPAFESDRHQCPICHKGMRGIRSFNEFKRALSFMGFQTYKDYLDSSFWKEIRRRILARDDKKCHCCGKEASIAHHRNYEFEVMMGNKDESLISVCNNCHCNIHYDRNGKKVSLEQSESRIERFKETGQWEKDGWDESGNPVKPPKRIKTTMKERPKRKFFAVWNGRRTGVIEGWPACRLSVNGWSNARYKAFETYEEAKAAFNRSC